MEEDAVLVVREGVVDLLVPDDAAVRRGDVHQLQPERVAHQVVRQHGRALQSGVGPSVPVWVGDIQLRYGDGVDLVRRLGHGALDRLLVLVREDRRHCGMAELVMVVKNWVRVRVRVRVRAVVGLCVCVQLSGGSCFALRLGST